MYDPVVRLLMIVMSTISAVGSLSIILTYLLFKKMREKKLIELMFYVSLSNFGTSIGSAMGIPRDGSALCWFQGIATNIFTLSSIFWTVVIALSLNRIVATAQMLDITPLVHLFCWILPAAISLVPISQVRYGSLGKEWCFYNARDDDFPDWNLAVWDWVGFYLWVFGSMIVILAIYVKIMGQRFLQLTHQRVADKLFNKLTYYPIMIMLCWTPAAIYDALDKVEDESKQNGIGNIITTTLACSQGVLVSSTFWIQNYDYVFGDASSKKAISSDGITGTNLFDSYNSVSEPLEQDARTSEMTNSIFGNSTKQVPEVGFDIPLYRGTNSTISKAETRRTGGDSIFV
jgi:hypothetical protein